MEDYVINDIALRSNMKKIIESYGNCFLDSKQPFLLFELNDSKAILNWYNKALTLLLGTDPTTLTLERAPAEVGEVNAKLGERSVCLNCWSIGEGCYAAIVKESSFAAPESAHIAAAEQSGLIIWEYDIIHDTLHHTEGSMRAHGADVRDEKNYSINLALSGRLMPESVPVMLELIKKLRGGERTASADVWRRSRESEEFWCEHIEYVSIISGGVAVRAVGAGRNITLERAMRIDSKKVAAALGDPLIWMWEYDIKSKTCVHEYYGENGEMVVDTIANVPDSLIESGHIAPQSVEDFRRLYAAIDDGAPRAGAEIRFIEPSGKKLWRQCTLTGVFDEDGSVHCAIGSGLDITLAKEMEMRLNEELSYQDTVTGEHLLVKLRVNLSKGILERFTSSIDSAVITAPMDYSDALEYISGTAAISSQRELLRTMLDPREIIAAFEAGRAINRFEYQRLMDSDEVVWVEVIVKVYQNPFDQDVMCFIYETDIDAKKTAQIIAERIAGVEYERFGLLDCERARMRITDVRGREHIKQLPDIPYSDYLKALSETLVNGEERARLLKLMSTENLVERLRTQEVYTLTFCVRGSDGEAEYRKWQFCYLDETHRFVLVTRSNVSELVADQMRAQELLKSALERAEAASVAKTEFLSRMSHEIRTPMNSIIGMSALAAQCVNEPEAVSDCIAKVGISARFLLSLINDILDMSRIESGTMSLKAESIPFEEFLNGINVICYEQAHVKGVDYDCIVTTLTEDCYIGDAMKLQQVLINIISNGIKFTPPGGKVQMIVSQERIDATRAHLRFTVNDTGIGISEEFLPKLFTPFEQEHTGATSSYGGTGLGLAICRNLVDMMGGKINVRSILGVGTEFTVELQLGISEQTRQRITTELNLSKMSALIVDDEVMICEYTYSLLKKMGMKAEWTDSGSAAIELVQKKLEKRSCYDVILLDWKMPEMDGIETARRIRRVVGPDVTIIVITAYDWSDIEAEARSAGVNMFITKPLFADSIVSAFEQAFLDKKRAVVSVEPREYDFSGKRILLVEDHLLNVEVAKRLLESKHADVEVAENGLIALEAYAAAPLNYFDAILMDIRMPVMDGLTSARSIRQLKKATAKTIPIIAMSANAFEEDVEGSRMAGMNAHIAKPIEPQLLFSVLEEHLRGK